MTTWLTHNRIRLALHHLRPDHLTPGTDPAARTLLLLHGLGERSPQRVPSWATDWPGPIAALDFTGHGDSTIPNGGGYSSEMLLADADAALAELGTVTLAGRGLGAYIALQLAGARPNEVVGAVLGDGPGLAGGPAEPTSLTVFPLQSDGSAPDPYALVELGRDLRPPDYATAFVRLALQGSPLDEPITVSAVYRPAWLQAVVSQQGVAEATASEALAVYASA